LPLLLTEIAFLHSLPRLTATFSARTLGRIAVVGLIAVTILGTLLPLLGATSPRDPLALIGVAIAILSALPLVGIAVTILGALTVIGVAVAILGATPIVGVAVAILGTSTVIGVAVAILGTSTVIGVAVAILGASTIISVAIAVLGTSAIVGVAALVWALFSPRGAWRIVAQAALLARAKRTRRRYVPLWPDLGGVSRTVACARKP